MADLPPGRAGCTVADQVRLQRSVLPLAGLTPITLRDGFARSLEPVRAPTDVNYLSLHSAVRLQIDSVVIHQLKSMDGMCLTPGWCSDSVTRLMIG